MNVKLLSAAEVAELTRLPPGTLRYFRHSGQGPASFKLGRRVMYRQEAVEAWIAEQEAVDTSRRTA